MKTIWQYIGRLIFYFAWPFWVIYFRIFSIRTRVVLIHGNQVLLIRGWLSDGKWMLPGGGVHRHEALEESAAREVSEETRITINPHKLGVIGDKSHNKLGIKYVAKIFIYELHLKQKPKPRFPEIIDAIWVSMDELTNYELNEETRYALELNQNSTSSRVL